MLYDQPPTIERNKRDVHLNFEEGKETAEILRNVLERYENDRVLVLAPPCAGKSTLLQHIENGIDMDLVFDSMPEEFKRYILHHEYPFMYIDGDRETIKYTEREFITGDRESEDHLRATTEALRRYTDEQMIILPGSPVFGTSLIDADVIVYLKLSDEVLDAHLQSRKLKTHRPTQRDRVHAIRQLMEEELAEVKGAGSRVEEIHIFNRNEDNT